VRQTLSVSERRVCRTLGQHRSTQRKVPYGLPDEERLTEDIIALTKDFGRYGYRMITGMLNNSGWHVNHKRPSCGLRANHKRAVVERIWRREGLKVPQKQPKKGWLWLNTSRDHALHDPAGQWTAPACDCGPSGQTTFGPMILFKIAPMMGASFGH